MGRVKNGRRRLGTRQMAVRKNVHYQVKQIVYICIGHLASYARSLQQNSLSERTYYHSYIINSVLGNWLCGLSGRVAGYM